MTVYAQGDQSDVTLHHKVIELPNEKCAGDIVSERHDIVLLVEVSKSNPNGDPDTGNMPRLQPDTLRGLITDVCLKRKVRNFFSLYSPKGEPWLVSFRMMGTVSLSRKTPYCSNLWRMTR